MPTSKPHVKAYLTPGEHAQVARQAQKTGLSISKYVKAASLGLPVKSIVDQQAILALMGSKADLGHLGGLVKHYLAEPPPGVGGSVQGQQDLRNLLRQIENTQRDLQRDYRVAITTLNEGVK